MGRTAGAKNKPKPVTINGEPPVKAKPVRIDFDRQAALEEESDMLHIPPELVPDGMRYNWKTASVFGQAQARRYAGIRQPVGSQSQLHGTRGYSRQRAMRAISSMTV